MGEESFRNPIRTPDLETRVAILRKRAEQDKVILPEDVALYIAQNVRSNASALEGALIRLLARSSLIGTDITLNYTKQVLKNFIDLQGSLLRELRQQINEDRNGLLVLGKDQSQSDVQADNALGILQ